MAKDSLNDLVNSIKSTNVTPKIYVACLAAYKNEKLHGRKINPTQEVEAIREEIQQMLSESPIAGAKEFVIHDFEGFGSLRLGKCESIESVHAKAIFIVRHHELGAELLVYHGDIESAQDAIENHYHGEHESQIEFAIQLFDSCHMDSIPEPIQCYIDYAAFKRDIFLGDFYSIEVGGKTHVFARN
jgi:antirestriction protein